MQHSDANGVEPNVVSLPSVVGAVEAAELKLTLEAAMAGHGGVRIEAGEVERVSTLGLQVLATAARSFAEQGIAFSFGACSPWLKQGAGLLGLAEILGIDGD